LKDASMTNDLIRGATDTTTKDLCPGNVDTPDVTEPFGSWLVSISRPGIDLDDALALLRSRAARPASIDAQA
jgi:hypothetical protein